MLTANQTIELQCTNRETSRSDMKPPFEWECGHIFSVRVEELSDSDGGYDTELPAAKCPECGRSVEVEWVAVRMRWDRSPGTIEYATEEDFDAAWVAGLKASELAKTRIQDRDKMERLIRLREIVAELEEEQGS